MTNERVMQLIREAREKNLTELNFSWKQLTRIPPEIGELKNITKLDLSNNKLTQLPPEIGELKSLTKLNLYNNQLTQIPPEIAQLINLTELYLPSNQLTRLPPEIGELKNLSKLHLYDNLLTQLPPEIAQLTNLTELYTSSNSISQLPPEIGELKSLKKLFLYNNQLTRLPSEIAQLKNLTELYLSSNHLTQLPPEISELINLRVLSLYENPLTSPPPEIVSLGIEAIFTYLKQLKTTENNEVKLILVGNGGVGKTCLAYRLINDKFLEDATITEGINISKWKITALESGHSEIKLNIWDFGGQEIYHATHQFFLTKRSIYVLVWNARKTKDYDHIYYWLNTIEAFGGDSPILLVMSKMNESDDDLNLSGLKSHFPQIKGYLKVDSKDGKGIPYLKEKILEVAWSIPLIGALWVDSWNKVREKLEGLGKYWISYNEFCKICISEGLDNENINILDGYLHELGVTLHFKDRVALKNIVILKPEWATNAFYSILSTKTVHHREGVLLHSELDHIWDYQTYPPDIHPQLMELMNKFELSYELPDKSSYLIPELLPKNAPDKFEWYKKGDLCFYYCYDSFLPPGIITRLIVRMHQDIEKKENDMPLCWRAGVVLKFESSCALVMVKPDDRQIEIRIKGSNKRWILGAICSQLDHINSSIKKVNISKQIPCNCSENCPQKYDYDNLLVAEMNNIETIQCHKRFKSISISSLLDGYMNKEERLRDKPDFNIVNQIYAYSESNSSTKVKQETNVKQETDVDLTVNIDLKIDLTQLQIDFDKLRREIKNSDPELKGELDEIQDSLDEVSANDNKDKLKKPINKLRRFLVNLGDPDSECNKIITGTQKGAELADKVLETFNKVAPVIEILALHGLH